MADDQVKDAPQPGDSWVNNIWIRNPDLEATCAALIDRGFKGQSLSREVLKRTGVMVSSHTIRTKLRSATHAPSVVDRELIEPADGFAVPAEPPPPKHKHPTGWEPHVEESGDTAVAISQPTAEQHPDERSLIESFGFDPDAWRIVGHVNNRRWEVTEPIKEKVEGTDGSTHWVTVGYDKKWLYYHKINLERFDGTAARELEQLHDDIRSWTPQQPVPPVDDSAEVAVAVCFADWQMGKRDGDGTAGIIRRIQRAIVELPRYVDQLRAQGRNVGALYIFGLGDMIENCAGHYPMQTFTAELNRRDQMKVVRRLIYTAVREWSHLFPRIILAAVGGNHGESRQDGKAFTDFGDNDDVAVFEQVAEGLQMNPEAFGHVSFILPNRDLTMTLDIYGTIVGLAHGHQTGKGANVFTKVVNWLKGQAHGGQYIADANVLFLGHHHFLWMSETGNKFVIQAPSVDGGSEWFEQLAGESSTSGVLACTIGASLGPFGVADWRLL